jgi:hypothetical protein
LLFLQFNLGQEIKPCTLRHLQIGDKQARKRVINAIRVNAGALEIFNRILPVGNYGKMVHHTDFLKAAVKGSTSFSWSSARNTMQCALKHGRARASPLNDSEKMEAGSEHADTSLTARETNCSGDAPNMLMPSMDLSQRSRKSDHWMGGMNPAMH